MSLAIVLRRIQIFLLVVTSLSTLYAADPAGPKIALQPLGPVKPDLLAQTKQALEQLYAVEVVLLPTRELPASAYYRPRDRYRAEKLLDWLQANADPQYVKIIGFTQSDISTTKDEFPDWGIFGLGQIGARPCVISSFRLARNVPRAKLLDRLAKSPAMKSATPSASPTAPSKAASCTTPAAKSPPSTANRASFAKPAASKSPPAPSSSILSASPK